MFVREEVEAIGFKGLTIHDDSGKNARRATERDLQDRVCEVKARQTLC